MKRARQNKNFMHQIFYRTKKLIRDSFRNEKKFEKVFERFDFKTKKLSKKKRRNVSEVQFSYEFDLLL